MRLRGLGHCRESPALGLEAVASAEGARTALPHPSCDGRDDLLYPCLLCCGPCPCHALGLGLGLCPGLDVCPCRPGSYLCYRSGLPAVCLAVQVTAAISSV